MPSAPLDLRSDTVTRPTPAMRQAMADAEVADDVLDGDPTVRRLEATIAERLGKSHALFFPTGTMANQAAVALHARPGTEIIVDADAHLVNLEVGASAAFTGAQLRLVRRASNVMSASDVVAALRPVTAHSIEPSLVVVENTHNGAGGTVTSLAEMVALRHVTRKQGLPIHLDGARLWNACVATGTSLADFAACADTIMVSFAKGLGAPVGAALIGDADVMSRASRVRRRMGGGMRQSGIVAAGALYGLLNHYDRLHEDHTAARALAAALSNISDVKVVAPDTNIVMIDLPKPIANEVASRAAAAGILVSVWTPTRLRAVTHLDAKIDAVEVAAPRLADAIASVLQ